MTMVILLGGPFDGLYAKLEYQTERIEIRREIYRRIDDPDTGLPLDGYSHVRKS